MNYVITHTTEYNYREPVSFCHNIARLAPRNTMRQTKQGFGIKISPQPEVINHYDDFFGNHVTYFAVQREHRKLSITVSSEVSIHSNSNYEIDLFRNTSWEEALTQMNEARPELFEPRQFIADTAFTTPDAEIAAYAMRSFTAGRPLFEAAQDLMRRIHHDFEFKPGFTIIATPLTVVMRERKGVCQDFAHLAIACIRAMGLPARYMSGYIETLPPEGKEKLTGVDASHAWFAVYIPGMGWAEFDPTNNQVPGDQHITIGWGRDYGDIAPLKGVLFSSSSQQLKVQVDIRRV
ncbi:transglutaminase family protein [Foetidibacter luteolus]|uniref:transglutaminase family protein n=1 Tax=Foetidibacter luteolus TaxID=2608880 RepID=UPI00129BECD8|nr:transglutaminase family protein [Foetidibacter luteolus]